MRGLNTKSAREDYRTAQFESLTSEGYTRETYKDVEIFTIEKHGKFYLKTFIGASTKMTDNYYSNNPFTSRIEQIKLNSDGRQAWKEKRKSEQKTTGRTGAAVSIRAELKTAFPDVKFSVKSDSFAGGDSVRISWTDGPTDEMVSSITKKYQYGSFNGMEDVYEYSNSRQDIPQSKYVQTSRTVSPEINEIVKSDLKNKFSEDTLDYEIDRMAYAIISKNSIPVGAVVNGIESTGNGAGLIEGVYRLSFEGVPTVQGESLSKVAAQVSQTEETYEKVESVAGQVNLIDYSEKAFAVIGDTRTIKEELKSLGGKFNPKLSCGAGWIFSKTKMDQVVKFLQGEPDTENQREEIAVAEISETQPDAVTTLQDEVRLTVEMLAETDVKIYGHVMEGTKEAAQVQNVDISKYQPNVKIYQSVEEIQTAAEGGKVISLCNYANLLNQNKTFKA